MRGIESCLRGIRGTAASYGYAIPICQNILMFSRVANSRRGCIQRKHHTHLEKGGFLTSILEGGVAALNPALDTAESWGWSSLLESRIRRPERPIIVEGIVKTLICGFQVRIKCVVGNGSVQLEMC